MVILRRLCLRAAGALCFWRTRSVPEEQPLEKPPPLLLWVDRFAIEHRPLLRSPESELALLAEVACRMMDLDMRYVPTMAQQQRIEQQVRSWLVELRVENAPGASSYDP